MKNKILTIFITVLVLFVLTACSDNKTKSVDIEEATVGDIIVLGSTEQDNNAENGNEDIEWLVLAKEDNRLLVVSKKVLASMAMRSDRAVPWESCPVRTWLNDTFLKESFSEEEQEMIQEVTVTTEDNETFGTDGGNDTTDKLFLLSYEEATKYFDSDEARMCEATDAAIVEGEYLLDPKGMSRWWLRNQGYSVNRFMRVSGGGVISEVGEDAEYATRVGVRPAMWIAY